MHIKYNDIKILPMWVAALLLLTSCKKDPPKELAKVGSLKVSFENYVGQSKLSLGSSDYVNAAGNVFDVSSLKYYISNLNLSGASGSVFVNKYFLIDESDHSTLTFILNDIPVETYDSFGLVVGVDSARNVSGAQTGALDPIKGMFWDWNTGYVMARMEGSSAESGALGDQLSFHIAGFKGPHNVIKNIELPLGTDNINIKEGKVSEIVLRMDLLEWFTSPKTISFDTLHTVVTGGAEAKLIADNYESMFSVYNVINP